MLLGSDRKTSYGMLIPNCSVMRRLIRLFNKCGGNECMVSSNIPLAFNCKMPEHTSQGMKIFYYRIDLARVQHWHTTLLASLINFSGAF